MKKGFNILLVLSMVLVVLSCSDKTKSYSDMLKDQKKAINRLFDRNELTTVKRFPDDSKFAGNEFYKLSNGVYLNVIDTGNGERAVAGRTIVYSRFIVNRFMVDTGYRLDNLSPTSGGTLPVEFIYGASSSNSSQGGLEIQEYLDAMFSTGMQSGLEYVGNYGKIKLIVPFQVGSSSAQSSGEAVYFEELQYIFD